MTLNLHTDETWKTQGKHTNFDDINDKFMLKSKSECTITGALNCVCKKFTSSN